MVGLEILPIFPLKPFPVLHTVALLNEQSGNKYIKVRNRAEGVVRKNWGKVTCMILVFIKEFIKSYYMWR